VTGDTGATGPQGIQGDTGAQGIQGIQGDTGAQGIQGIQGETGATGATGVGLVAGGTTGQVLSKASATDYDTVWIDAGGGGGGASALNDLTDVSLLSVVDGDLLRYNGTASEWQNTNLGISIAPTILFPTGTIYSNLELTFTVTNHASYDEPAYFFQLKNGATVIVDNDSFTINGGSITFTTPADGSYTLESRTQDFGDLASEITSTSITVVPTPALRYYRLTFIGGVSHNFVRNFRVYTQANQRGMLPTNMTSDTSPSPYVASSSGHYPSTSYANYRAFDSSITSSGWWNLTKTPYSTAWLQIDVGSYVNIVGASIVFNPSYKNYTSLKISGSTNGSFSGEEIDIFTTTSQDATIIFG
jgi:hypothetical protein